MEDPLCPEPGRRCCDPSAQPGANGKPHCFEGATCCKDGRWRCIEADGSPKAIYFIAHWCPHCQAEVPLVQGLIDDGRKPDALDIYAVSTAVDRGRGNYPPVDWLEEEGFTPIVVRDDDASSAFVEFGGGLGKGEGPAEKRPNLEGIIKKTLKAKAYEAEYLGAINLATLEETAARFAA